MVNCLSILSSYYNNLFVFLKRKYNFKQFSYAPNTILAIIKDLDFSFVTISSLHYNIGSIPLSYFLLKKPPTHFFNFNMPAGEAFTKPKKLSEDLADICGVEVC